MPANLVWTNATTNGIFDDPQNWWNFDTNNVAVVPSSPHSGDSWRVIQSPAGFIDNDDPSVTPSAVWKMEKDPANPAKFWALVAK